LSRFAPATSTLIAPTAWIKRTTGCHAIVPGANQTDGDEPSR